ncbi:MAG TPA: diacylglycerol kinase family lipid kinase [Saprospiraceae bacterium]|nr:diacylglycerol kinase family lipid kinase [Saprospiraceae bacterium]
MKKQKIVFIVNPFSGTGSKKKIKSLIYKHLDTTRFDISFYISEYPGHAAILTRLAIDNSADIVAAVGGDGTLNEVGSVLIHSDTIMAIVPAGSGNGFAYHLGLGRNISKALKAVNEGNTLWIDTCILNDKKYINVAGLGFDAKIAYLTKQRTQRGFLPYFLTTIKESLKFTTEHLTFVIDGKIFRGNYAIAVVSNASMYGYNFSISPTACINDGYMDLTLVKEAPVYKYFLITYRYFNKTLHRSSLVETYRAKSIKISSGRPVHYHVDGEGFNVEENFNFQIQPKSLRIIVPADFQ